MTARMERTLPPTATAGPVGSVIAHGDTDGGWWRRAQSAVRGRSQFLVNIVSNAGGNTLNSILQLFLLLALGRLLEDGVFAAYLTAGAIIGIGEVASDFGTRLWAVRRFAATQNSAQTLELCFSNKLVFTIVAICVFGLLPLNTLPFSVLVLSLLVASTQPGSDPFLWYLRGRERFDVEAALVLCCRIAIVIGLLAASWNHASLSTLLLIWLCCNGIRMIAESRLPISRTLFQDVPETRCTAIQQWRSLCGVFPIGISLILAPLFAHSVVLYVRMHGSDTDVNQFGTAFKLVHAAGFIGTSIVVSSFARLSKAIQSSDPVATKQVIRTKILLVTLAMCPVCVLGVLLSAPFANAILRPEQAHAGRMMVLLMPGLYLCCVNMAAKFTLNAFELNRQDVMAMLMGIGVFFSLLFVLPQLTAISLPLRATISWTLGEATVLCCRYVFLYRQNRHHGMSIGLMASATILLATLAITMHCYGWR